MTIICIYPYITCSQSKPAQIPGQNQRLFSLQNQCREVVNQPDKWARVPTLIQATYVVTRKHKQSPLLKAMAKRLSVHSAVPLEGWCHGLLSIWLLNN